MAVSTSAQAVLFAILSMLVWAVLPIALGWIPTTVMTGSMEPRIYPGDVVVARPVPLGTAALNHILLVDDPDFEGKLRLHRLVDFTPDGDLILRGDANAANDSTPVAPDAVHGVAVLRIPLVGLPAVWFAEKNWGAVAGVLVGVATLTLAAASGKNPGNSGPRHRTPSRWSTRALVCKKRTVLAFLAVATIPALVSTTPTVVLPVYAAFSAYIRTSDNNFAAASNFPCLAPTLSDNPYFFYPFNEASGASATDVSGNTRNGTLNAATRVSGSCRPGPSPALSFSGTSGYVSAPKDQAFPTSPNTFTLEIWFKTASSGGKGGRLIGFGDQQTGTSHTTDRHLYMTDTGTIAFGVGATGGREAPTIISSGRYNDGKWHQATVTVAPEAAGLNAALYMDNVLEIASTLGKPPGYQGSWRIGYDSLPTSLWRNAPASPFFTGSVDNAAVYSTALSAAQVKTHYDQVKCHYIACP